MSNIEKFCNGFRCELVTRYDVAKREWYMHLYSTKKSAHLINTEVKGESYDELLALISERIQRLRKEIANG